MLTGVISRGEGKSPLKFTNVEFVLFTTLANKNINYFPFKHQIIAWEI